jgi:hypothetical protein
MDKKIKVVKTKTKAKAKAKGKAKAKAKVKTTTTSTKSKNVNVSKNINTVKVVVNPEQKKTTTRRRKTTQPTNKINLADRLIIAQNNLRNDIQRELAISRKEKEEAKAIEKDTQAIKDIENRIIEQQKQREEKILEDSRNQFNFLKREGKKITERQKEEKEQIEQLLSPIKEKQKSVSFGGLPFAESQEINIAEAVEKRKPGRPKKQPGDPKSPYVRKKDKDKGAEDKGAEQDK